MLLNRLRESLAQACRDGGDDTESAVRTLLAKDGLFARDSAPVALVRADGSIVAANSMAARMTPSLSNGGALISHVRDALATGIARRETLDLGDGENAGGVWEFVVLPLPGGGAALVQGHNVTRDRTLREALVDSRQRYKDLVEISSDFVWETGPDGRFAFVSPGGAMGYAADELVDRHPSEFIPKSVSTGAALPFLATERVGDVDVWFRHADGRAALLVASAMPLVDRQGRWIGARGACRDVTEERERDATLAAVLTREKLLAYITRVTHDEINPADMLEAAATAVARALSAVNCRIYRVDAAGRFLLAAEYGTPPADDALEQSLLLRTADDDEPIMESDADRHVMCEATNYRKQVNGAISVTRAAEAGPWSRDDIILARDIALQLAIAIEQIEYHGKLETLSRTDELTKLLNRRAFFQELESRIERDSSILGAGVLFFVDLDNFKLVNDVHGHQAGDDALVMVAAILSDNTRPGDLVSRFGGDEFALWLDRTDEDAAILRARDLLDAARTLKEFSGDPARPLSMSVGIASWTPGAGETVAGLTARADAAMYEIKRGSKSGYVVAAPYAASDEMVEAPA